MPLTLTMGLLLLEQGKACWARQCRCSWLRTREGIGHVDEEEKEIYSPPHKAGSSLHPAQSL